ncbi:hypothetical protein [Argonema galeatum]|uniref:hypothetical protein n=1 Tax=Argonema galeatum TaxID=2942762 RepID=UPI002013A26C|nr:hypothetical protein [Argonema galeatum]MCL1463862.1 hypothetical protein [Argonema galeatum A003/A1]
MTVRSVKSLRIKTKPVKVDRAKYGGQLSTLTKPEKIFVAQIHKAISGNRENLPVEGTQSARVWAKLELNNISVSI